jgi:small subunit ribosomal protein S4
VNIPSYTIKVSDTVEVAGKSKKMDRISENLKTVERRGVPEWLALDKDNFKGTVTRPPGREDVTIPIHEQLIVELYSK